MTEAKRLNARASVLVQKRVAVIDVWRRNRKKFVEKTAKPTWTSVWQNAGKKNPEISELNAFHWNSIFIFLLILDVLFFLSGFSSDTVASPLNVKANVRVQFVIALNHGLYVKRMATPFLESNATTLAGYILYFMY